MRGLAVLPWQEKDLLDLPLVVPSIFGFFDSRCRLVDGDWWFDWLIGFLCIVCGDSGMGRWRDREKKQRNEDRS